MTTCKHCGEVSDGLSCENDCEELRAIYRAEQRERLNADVSEDDADYKALIASIEYEVWEFCDHCSGLGEIETDNNGPIVRCPVCDGTGDKW